MYADADAYKAHLETPHFKKYKATTQKMVKSLRLTETVPIMLSAGHTHHWTPLIRSAVDCGEYCQPSWPRSCRSYIDVAQGGF